MKITKLGAFILTGMLATTYSRAQSTEDPVLDLMVKKGLVTQSEADQARAEEKQDQENVPASTLIQLQDPSVQKLVFYGDGRLRWENIDQHNHDAAFTLNDRERYRLRFGADYFYSDHFKGGFELESSTTNDSANQSFGGEFTKASINVGKIYLQYQPTDWLTLIGGKFSNPWYTTTDIVYSFDLNPEGGAELFNYTIPLSGGATSVASTGDSKDMKDAKDVKHGSDPGPDSSLSIAFNAVQYIYVNGNEANITPGINNNDVFIIGEQIPITYKMNKDVTFKVAPGFTFYTGGGNTSFDGGDPTNTNTGISGAVPAPSNGIPSQPYYATANSSVDPVFISPREADDLDIFSAPGEVNFKIAGVPIRPYWDFELNADGHRRVQNVYLDSSARLGGFATTGVSAAAHAENRDLTDNIAWGAGVQVGSNKKKGDWSALGEFRQIGLGAVDQNINGTDFADSFANQEGLKFAAAYNLTDFFTATITYYDSWDYKPGLYQSLGGKTATPSPVTASTLNLISEKSLQRVQVDLGWKF